MFLLRLFLIIHKQRDWKDSPFVNVVVTVISNILICSFGGDTQFGNRVQDSGHGSRRRRSNSNRISNPIIGVDTVLVLLLLFYFFSFEIGKQWVSWWQERQQWQWRYWCWCWCWCCLLFVGEPSVCCTYGWVRYSHFSLPHVIGAISFIISCECDKD